MAWCPPITCLRHSSPPPPQHCSSRSFAQLLGAEARAGALAPRDAGRAHARVSARPGGEGRVAARGSGCKLEVKRSRQLRLVS